LMVVLPFPLVYGATIPLGIALVALGQLLRLAAARPLLSALLALGVAGTLSWSHAGDREPVPYALDFLARFVDNRGNLERPLVIEGPAVQALLRGLGHGARGEQRLLLSGQHLQDVSVTRSGGRVVV